jgi:D-aminoacyl-tRNA deacylase
MRIILQRVTASSVSVAGETIGSIGRGYTLLLGITATDSEAELDWLVKKCLNLRLFPDSDGKAWSQTIQEVNGEVLVISQFTLYGDCRKGRKPSFSNAAPPEQAEKLYDQFVDRLSFAGLNKVASGQFGADMQVTIENDGPVTLILEREA